MEVLTEQEPHVKHPDSNILAAAGGVVVLTGG